MIIGLDAGEGSVYLARREALGGRPVALKVMQSSLNTSSRGHNRFLAEARALAKVRHANIVTVHDVIEDGSTIAYAMEWIEGSSLDKLIQEQTEREPIQQHHVSPRCPAQRAEIHRLRHTQLVAIKNAEDARTAQMAAETAQSEESKRADELKQVAQFQAEQFGKIDPQMMGIRLRRSLIEAVENERQEEVDASFSGINFTTIALGSLQDSIFEQTISSIGEQFEDQPLVLARLLQAIAIVVRKLGLYELVDSPQSRVLEIRRRLHGTDHPDTLVSINNMGSILRLQGKLRELLREAVEGNRRTRGVDHPETLNAISNLGWILSDQKDYSEAEPLYLEALEGMRRALGKEHFRTLGAINAMGLLLQAQGKLAEAEPYFREAMEERRRVFGNELQEIFNSIEALSSLLSGLERFAKSVSLANESYEIHRATHGESHDGTAGAIVNILKIYTSRHEAEPDGGFDIQIDEWQAKLDAIQSGVGQDG